MVDINSLEASLEAIYLDAEKETWTTLKHSMTCLSLFPAPEPKDDIDQFPSRDGGDLQIRFWSDTLILVKKSLTMRKEQELQRDA